MSEVAPGHFYTKQHEWVREEGDLLILGISDHAQASLGDVVFVDLKEVGTTLAVGDSFGAIESVKAAEDLYTPVSGTVAQVNSELNETPQAVNEKAYGAWMVKLKDYDKDALQNLMNSDAYADYLKTLPD